MSQGQLSSARLRFILFAYACMGFAGLSSASLCFGMSLVTLCFAKLRFATLCCDLFRYVTLRFVRLGF